MSRYVAVALAALMAGGCQTYQQQPLDSAAMLRSWEQRSNNLLATVATHDLRSTQPTPRESSLLELRDAETVALLLNPQLRRARLEANVARVGAAEAGRWADPSIGIDIERILSAANDPWVIGGIVNLTIPLSGRLGAEKDLAIAEADRAHFAVLWQERQTIAKLQRAWVEWQSASDRAKTLADSLDNLTTIHSSIELLLAAGEIDPTDARLFTIDLARRRVQLMGARRDVKRHEHLVRQVIGLTPDAPLALVPSDIRPVDADDVDAPEFHPRLMVARAEYAAAERSLALAIRSQYPDIEIGGGLGSDEGDTRLLGGLSIPIPMLNRSQREIAEARAKRDAARAAFETDLLSLVTDRVAADAEIEAAQASLEAIRETVVPLVDRQIAEARRLLDAGEFSPLVVRDAIAAATEVHIEMNTAKRDLAIARIEQRLLTETPSQNSKVKP